MIISGLPFIQEKLTHPAFEAKCIFNDEAIAFFPVSKQHKEVKTYGLSYEDDYQGNALAAMVKPGMVEIRFHKAFTDAQIRLIWNQITAHPDAAFLQGWKVTYQGRDV
jgi:hypothetical protein